jgi:uncharacterized membrane protein HdeD (DUF308 family)
MSATESSHTTRTITAVGRSHGWQIALGALTVVAGLLVLLWPDATLLVVAVVVGSLLIVAGIFRVVTAFSLDTDSAGVRAMFLLLGLLLIIVGILCLRSPFRTIAILVLLFGVSWIVNGVIEMFRGFAGDGGWAAAAGTVSVLAGIVVLVYPVPSVVTMIWLFGIALIVVGVAEIAGAVSRISRSRATTRVQRAAGPATS